MIPYKGNKSAIVGNIIKILKLRFPHHTDFYDLFGGGGTVSVEATKLFKKVHYNEILPYIHKAFESLLNGSFRSELLINEWISRDKFFEIKNGADTARKGLVLSCWSFGNNCSSYIYGKDIEEWKEALHRICFARTKTEIIDCFRILEKRVFKKPTNYTILFDDSKAGYLLSLPKGSERRYKLKYCILKRTIDQGESLERLQSLQSLESLESLERLEITTSNLSYEKVEAKGLLYCDIPYRTKASKNAYGGGFDHDRFYEWAKNNENTVVFSEYLENLPDGFQVICKLKKRNLAAGGTGLMANEILAWNRK